ncbi:lysozyme [Brevundimonas subvibrioides]|uniref:Lysozyme n=1 Tax=Brevundimonas subvibrioides (strain ATCC 15264 / DSM 4735 / LMG 14903 / NBRC 16000 / CB 81) TaxID=633149 RepID=D9QKP3_BRESC|nr:lysozyme [Brevundimonas subvibrioides]ADL01707.1 glycoside hydrolase family 24 [Brevundimonas subvibrioides ATCC 15264]
MKISREGIILIKSFEGFRPRAIRREDGGWVIGYGHTLSAREGASVSEADAELLLRYDLLPVEKTVNHAGSAVLNQHQFDALVSFAYSVGVDRFQTSDVLGHLARGATGHAADALMGWPEPALPQAALRRRAAERALFVADPAAPVAVSDLLVAPIEIVEPETWVETVETPVDASGAPRETSAEQMPEADPRTAAVSALLGEADAVLVPSFAVPPPVAEPVVADQDVVEAPPSAANDSLADDEGADSAGVPEPADPAVDVPVEGEDAPTDVEPAPTSDAVPVASPETDAPTGAAGSPVTGTDHAAIIVQRYTPYSAAMVGPLPFLQPARERVIAESVTPPPVVHEEVLVAVEPVVEAPVVEPGPAVEPESVSFAPAAEIEPLVLNGADDFPDAAVTRAPWTAEDRAEPADTADGGLFGEDLSLTQGGAPVMRHGDIELEAPASFDWSETGAFIIMGAVGLTAFGAAMAAFRLASEQSGGDETTIIAWVLAVIGAACVGVSSFNLYRRWGLPGGDN